MPKAQGILTTGSLFLLSFFVHSATNGSSPSHNPEAKPPRVDGTVQVRGEGPWSASCRYWAVVRGNQTQCLGEGWGLPERYAHGLRPDITALVGTVPDPLHGHLELDFDRSIDALIQAAAGSHYVPSYYWLPWKPKTAKESTGLSKEDEE